MGQAKDRKARLGEWYGRPSVPGHPDFVPPKKPERIAAPETTREEPMHPEAARTPSGIDEAREDGLHAPQMASRRFPGMLPKNRRLHGMATLAILGLALASGIDLGPVPECRPKKR